VKRLNVDLPLNLLLDGEHAGVSGDEVLEVAVHVILPQEVVVREVEQVLVHHGLQL